MVNNYNYGTTVLEDILKHIGINLQGADYLISKTQDTSVMKHYWGNFWPPRVTLFHWFSKILTNGLLLLIQVHCPCLKVSNSPPLTSVTTWKAPSDQTPSRSSACMCLIVLHTAALGSPNTLKQSILRAGHFAVLFDVNPISSCIRGWTITNKRTTFDQTDFGEKYASLWTAESSCCLQSGHKQEKNSCQLVCTMISSK